MKLLSDDAYKAARKQTVEEMQHWRDIFIKLIKESKLGCSSIGGAFDSESKG